MGHSTRLRVGVGNRCAHMYWGKIFSRAVVVELAICMWGGWRRELDIASWGGSRLEGTDAIRSGGLLLTNRGKTPQPKANPTQEDVGFKWRLGRFFPTAKYFFVGRDLILYTYVGNCENPNSTKLSAPYS